MFLTTLYVPLTGDVRLIPGRLNPRRLIPMTLDSKVEGGRLIPMTFDSGRLIPGRLIPRMFDSPDV